MLNPGPSCLEIKGYLYRPLPSTVEAPHRLFRVLQQSENRLGWWALGPVFHDAQETSSFTRWENSAWDLGREKKLRSDLPPSSVIPNTLMLVHLPFVRTNDAEAAELTTHLQVTSFGANVITIRRLSRYRVHFPWKMLLKGYVSFLTPSGLWWN